MKKLFFFFSFFVSYITYAQSNRYETTISKIEPQREKIYFLGAGLSNYTKLRPLKYADKDVKDFLNFFKQQFEPQKYEIEVDTFTNENITANKITLKLAEILNEEKNNLNRIYLLFSSHGGTSDTTNTDSYLYLDKDVSVFSPHKIGSGVIKIRALEHYIEQFIEQGSSVILIIDACHAGGVNPKRLGQDIRKWANTSQSVKFLACLAEEQSLESDSLENGLLVHYFIKGANDDAELNNNGKIETFELKKYLASNVSAEALKQKHIQNPLVIGADSVVISEVKNVALASTPKQQWSLGSFQKPNSQIIPKSFNPKQIIQPDSTELINKKIKDALKKKDLNGAYNLLNQYRKLDSTKNYSNLKFECLNACNVEAISLSEKLTNTHLDANFFFNRKSDKDLENQITSIVINLSNCQKLLNSKNPFYEDIEYRKLVFEGYLEKNTEKLYKAIPISPDFGYPYIIMARIFYKRGQFLEAIEALDKFDKFVPDEKEKILDFKQKINTEKIALEYFKKNISGTQKIKKQSFEQIKNVPDPLQLLSNVQLSEPKYGRLMDSLTIVAMDGSFVIESGKTFKPPFYTPGWINPNSDFVKAFKQSTNGIKVKVIIKRSLYLYENEITNALTRGFKPQLTSTTPTDSTKRIRYRQETEVLYGLLEFNTVHDACSNEPNTRAYYISIPPSYTQAAKGGNISVMYEYYRCKPMGSKEENKYTSWVLWLSDIEF